LGIHPFPKTPPKKKLSLKNPYLEGWLRGVDSSKVYIPTSSKHLIEHHACEWKTHIQMGINGVFFPIGRFAYGRGVDVFLVWPFPSQA
jgi:hypothetical protein